MPYELVSVHYGLWMKHLPIDERAAERPWLQIGMIEPERKRRKPTKAEGF